jgi:hypothetical protein
VGRSLFYADHSSDKRSVSDLGQIAFRQLFYPRPNDSASSIAMTLLDAKGLFVFAGAGVSKPPPSNLPTFGRIRDEVLRQINLEPFIPSERGAPARLTSVTEGVATESFMLALTRGSMEAETWLKAVLDGDSNAAHRPVSNVAHKALFQLAKAGARVWTVNFDTRIEDVNPGHRFPIHTWSSLAG